MSRIHEALSRRDFDSIALFLEQGDAVDAREEGGITPLMLAATESEPMVRLLLEHGANVFAEDMHGASALCYAGRLGDAQTIRTLLEWGAGGNTAHVQNAFEATFVEDGHVCNAPLFLVVGAKPGLYEALQLGDGETVRRLVVEGKVDVKSDPAPLYEAIHRGDIGSVRLFLEYGANPDGFGGDGTPILRALERGSSGLIVKALLEAGADLNCRTVQGEIPLTVRTDLYTLEAIKAMVEFGADVNSRNVLGETALMKASACGQVLVAEYLLKQGADPRLRDNRGWTALTHATKTGKEAVIRLLTTNPPEWRLPHRQASASTPS